MKYNNSKSRRDFLRTAGSAALGTAMGQQLMTCQRNNVSNEQPNLLFIFSDQHRAHTLGCYGESQITTLNFDRFAGQGAQLMHAVSPTPVCGPYRATMMTGLYSHHTGVTTNALSGTLNPDLPCIGRTFRDAGYHTGYIGKWHLYARVNVDKGSPYRLGFDEWAANYGGHEYWDWYYYTDSRNRVEGTEYQPAMETDVCIDFLKRNRQKKWCLFLSWGPPHSANKAAPEFYRHLSDLNPRSNVLSAEDRTYFKKIAPKYYGLVENLDSEFGRILTALDELGLSENTIVVYTSDHGDMLGSQGLRAKRWPYEESIHVPFLIRYPAAIPAGQQPELLFSSIDIFPTLAGLAGVTIKEPENPDIYHVPHLMPPGLPGCERTGPVDGTDYSGLLTETRRIDEPECAYLTMHYGYVPWPGWKGIRTHRYLYARIKEQPWLLFDMDNDPYQKRNLIKETGHNSLIKELGTYLLDTMHRVGDAWYLRSPGTRYQGRMAKERLI